MEYLSGSYYTCKKHSEDPRVQEMGGRLIDDGKSETMRYFTVQQHSRQVDEKANKDSILE